MRDPGSGIHWNSIHGDMRNSDGFPYPSADEYSVEWRALAGAAILFGPSIDAAGNLYVCSGQGNGASHLHSFSPSGEPRWAAPVASEAASLGPRSVPFAPLLDDEGGVYVADEDRFWCFENTGETRWSTDLAPLGVGGGFASAVFSPGGHVGGLSLDGTALLLRRDTGEPACAPLQLPLGDAPPALDVPDGLWRGMMDPGTRDAIFPAFFGTGFSLTNSPAVSHATGMIYITAAASTLGRTCLLGILERNHSLEIALNVEFDGFCSVTPSISCDGLTVYTGNHLGQLMAFDALTGALLWAYEPGATAASPSVGTDGVVYTGCTVRGDGPSLLSALDPHTGKAIWQRDYDELAKEYLPNRSVLEGFFPEPGPRASINSVPSVTETHVLVVLTMGYTFAPAGRGPMIQPHKSVLASINPKDGSLLGVTELEDTSEASVVVGPSGRAYTPHASLTSSIFTEINKMLPPSHQTSLRASGGFSALRAALTTSG